MEVAASERYSPPPSFSLFLHSPFIPLKLRRSLCTLPPLHRRSLLPRSHHPVRHHLVLAREIGGAGGGQGQNREGRRERRELTSKAKYNKSRRHCWVTLQREFCRRVGGGLTAPCDESQSHPSRPTRSSLARPRFPGGSGRTGLRGASG